MEKALQRLQQTCSPGSAGVVTRAGVSGEEVMHLLPQDSVICRSPCFSSLESLLRLRDEAKKLQDRLISGLSQVYDSASVAQSVASSSVVPSPKCPCLAYPNRLAGRQLFCHKSNDSGVARRGQKGQLPLPLFSRTHWG